MSTCRGCGTPNRPGRALCVVCGERLVSSDPPSEHGGSPSESLVGAAAVAPEASPPESRHAPHVERTAAFDRAGFRPPTLLGVGASEIPDPPERERAAPEEAPEATAQRRVPTTVPPSAAASSTIPPTAALPAVDLPVASSRAEEALQASPAPVVDSLPRPARRRWLLVLGALSLLLGTAASGAAFLLYRTQASATPPGVRAQVVPNGIGQVPPFATLYVTAPAAAQVIVAAPALAPAGAPAGSEAKLGPWRLDLSADARGEEPALHVLERHIELDVRFTDGASRRSTVSFQAPVTPLVLHGPGPRWVTQPGTLIISGKTQAGALVQAGTSRTRADAHGQFLLPIRQPAPSALTVSAHAEGSVVRYVSLQIAAQTEVPASVPFADLAHRLGRRVRVDGKIVDVRERPAGTTLLLDVDCPADVNGPCRVSALHPIEPGSPGAPTYTPGRKLTVVGDVTVTGSLPHLRAEWIQPL